MDTESDVIDLATELRRARTFAVTLSRRMLDLLWTIDLHGRLEETTFVRGRTPPVIVGNLLQRRALRRLVRFGYVRREAGALTLTVAGLAVVHPLASQTDIQRMRSR